MRFGLALPAISFLVLAITGCSNNRLAESSPGQTPESINPNAPNYGQAGGPLVPPNYPNAGTTAPAPAPQARVFTVYFAFGKATLSPEARSVIEQAVGATKQGSFTHITVTGHTDTVGSERYNQGLSERRAAAVQAELTAEGVPPDEIVASGVGKSDLAVPTAEGVKEPRNRRVVITEGGPGA